MTFWTEKPPDKAVGFSSTELNIENVFDELF